MASKVVALLPRALNYSLTYASGEQYDITLRAPKPRKVKGPFTITLTGHPGGLSPDTCGAWKVDMYNFADCAEAGWNRVGDLNDGKLLQ